MLRLAFDFIITWRETRTRPNAYLKLSIHIMIILFLESSLIVPVELSVGDVRSIWMHLIRK